MTFRRQPISVSAKPKQQDDNDKDTISSQVLQPRPILETVGISLVWLFIWYRLLPTWPVIEVMDDWKIFWVAAGAWNIGLSATAFCWPQVLDTQEADRPAWMAVGAAGVVYASFAHSPTPLEFTIPIFALLKVGVLPFLYQKGRLNWESSWSLLWLIIAVGDALFAKQFMEYSLHHGSLV
jgi:hypothetical protein